MMTNMSDTTATSHEGVSKTCTISINSIFLTRVPQIHQLISSVFHQDVRKVCSGCISPSCFFNSVEYKIQGRSEYLKNRTKPLKTSPIEFLPFR